MRDLPAKEFEGKPCRACGRTRRFIHTRRCISCRRARSRENRVRWYHRYGSNLYRKLGITIAQFYEMAEAQEWKCLICHRTPAESLQVDHCHKTNKIRGLLCKRCNMGLGYFKDNPEILHAAAEYLIGSQNA